MSFNRPGVETVQRGMGFNVVNKCRYGFADKVIGFELPEGAEFFAFDDP